MKIALIGVTGRVGSRLRLSFCPVATPLPESRCTSRPTSAPALRSCRPMRRIQTLLRRHVVGHDAVISTSRFVTLDADALVSAVKTAGVKRLLVVGGAGSLEVAPGKALMDTDGFPEAFKAEAKAGARFLERLRAEPDLDLTFLSPSADFTPGERTGHFRLGGDQLLRDAQGKSHIYRDGR